MQRDLYSAAILDRYIYKTFLGNDSIILGFPGSLRTKVLQKLVTIATVPDSLMLQTVKMSFGRAVL